MSKVFDWLIDLIFPNRCPFCSEIIPWDKKLCSKCESSVKKIYFCPKCGQHECVCKGSTLCYDSCAVVYPYSGKVRIGVLRLKYRQGFETARFIVPQLAELLRECEGDIVTAVPMTKKRRRETGYNQAEYIAKLLAKELKLPCDLKLIGKSGDAKTQHSLTAKERRIAAESSYYAKSNRRIEGKTVILCDDIITTGSTLSECARVLKEMGAEKVRCAVLSGTCLDKNSSDSEEENVGT